MRRRVCPVVLPIGGEAELTTGRTTKRRASSFGMAMMALPRLLTLTATGRATPMASPLLELSWQLISERELLIT